MTSDIQTDVLSGQLEAGERATGIIRPAITNLGEAKVRELQEHLGIDGGLLDEACKSVFSEDTWSLWDVVTASRVSTLFSRLTEVSASAPGSVLQSARELLRYIVNHPRWWPEPSVEALIKLAKPVHLRDWDLLVALRRRQGGSDCDLQERFDSMCGPNALVNLDRLATIADEQAAQEMEDALCAGEESDEEEKVLHGTRLATDEVSAANAALPHFNVFHTGSGKPVPPPGSTASGEPRGEASGSAYAPPSKVPRSS